MTPAASSSPSAAHYADQAVWQRAAIEENVRLAHRTYRVRLRCPKIAQRIMPGQFLMLRLEGRSDPLLGRPMALYDTAADDGDRPQAIDVVYLVLGKMTSELARLPEGQALEVWGPLGNGFRPRPARHLVMVAGGIGQTPFLALARESLGGRQYGQPPRQGGGVQRVTLCYGVRRGDMAAGVDDFRRAGVDVRLASEDASLGHHGRVTDLVEPLLEGPRDGVRVVCCGPEPMMERVAAMTQTAGVPCEVSLESPMACGIGICFSCVVRVRQPGGGWDYRRACVDGPVFAAEGIEWVPSDQGQHFQGEGT